MRVVAMFRVSTEKQANEGASLDSQERAYRALAAQRGWTTVAEFRGCESATQAASDRRVLGAVLQCIRGQSPDALYVHEQSRLTRGDELDTALLVRELRDQNVKVLVAGEARDLASIDGGFVFGVQTLVDRAESQRIKERMMRGKREKARQGKKTAGPAPYGYLNPPPGAAGRGTLVVVPEEAVVIRRIFELAGAGRGEQAIANTLSEQGCPAPRGGKWGKSTIRRILHCPAYRGVAASNVWRAEKGTRTFRFDPRNEKAILIEDAHPAIIDRETWDAAQNREKRVCTKIPRMLTGFLVVNGQPASGDSGKGRAFYRGRRGVRGAPWLDAEPCEAAVWSAFVSLATGPEFVQALFEEARTPRDQQMLEMEIDHAADQLAKQRRRQARLIDMRADGEITKDDFRLKADQASAAISALERELAELRAKAVVADGTHAVRVVRAVQTLLAGQTRLSREQKRSILNSIVRRVEVAAERTGATFARDAGGRIVPCKLQTWAIKSVTFQLALPGNDDACPVERVPARGGQLVTNPSDCAHAAAVAERSSLGHRGGQLVTNPSDCAHAAAVAERSSLGHRGGQLVTNPLDCAHLPDTENWGSLGHRVGQLDTNFWDCDQVTVTVAVAAAE